MDVTEAVYKRKSIRGFLSTPVLDDELAMLLNKAARAPSGGNVQPWRIYVLNGSRMDDFKTHLENFSLSESEYPIYPPKLEEPYRTNRFELGEEMYELLGIPREDKAARLANMSKNYDFFGAPAAFFCFIDRSMGAAQCQILACSCKRLCFWQKKLVWALARKKHGQCIIRQYQNLFQHQKMKCSSAECP